MPGQNLFDVLFNHAPDVCGRPGECKHFFGLVLAM